MMTGETVGQWESDRNTVISESTRVISVHLLHELVALRAQIAACQRLLNYNRSTAGMSDGSDTVDRLEVMARVNEDVIASVTDWLRTQVVALHDPEMARRIVRSERDGREND
jgi:hypothetical protein